MIGPVKVNVPVVAINPDPGIQAGFHSSQPEDPRGDQVALLVLGRKLPEALARGNSATEDCTARFAVAELIGNFMETPRCTPGTMGAGGRRDGSGDGQGALEGTVEEDGEDLVGQ